MDISGLKRTGRHTCLLTAGGTQPNGYLREAVDLTLDLNALFPKEE